MPVAGRAGVLEDPLAAPGAAPPLPPGTSDPHAASASALASRVNLRRWSLAVMVNDYDPEMVNEPEIP
jgi:hypothetical protein